MTAESEEVFDVAYDLMQRIADADPKTPEALREILVGSLRELPGGMGAVSDGHHTIDELYTHRRALTAVLATLGAANDAAWRSRQHHPDDETPMFDGCFLVGIDLPTGQVRYHYGVEHWDDFSQVPEIPWAPKWDGVGPDGTLRILFEAAETPVKE